MPLTDIPVEYCLIIGAIVLVFMVLAASNPKASSKSMERMIRDYEIFTDRANDVTNDIREIIKRLQNKIFLSVSDREDAEALIKEFDAQYSETLANHKKMGFYLSKRSVKYYNRHRKKAGYHLEQLQGIRDALMDAEVYTQTKEEYFYSHRNVYGSEDSKDNNAYTRNYAGNFDREDANEQECRTPPSDEKPKGGKDVFFTGCDTIEDLEKRYRSLAKVYHPDMPTGNKEIFQKMQEEYERRKFLL